MKEITMRFHEDPSSFFRKLIPLEKAAELLFMPAPELADLVESGDAPCVRIAGGPPLFYKKDLLAWAREFLLEVQAGSWEFRPRTYGASGEVLHPLEVPTELRGVHGLTELMMPPPFCVYFLVRANQVLYVGKSADLMSRIAAHTREGKKFDRILLIGVRRDEMDRVEGALIRALRPPLNLNERGNVCGAAVVNDLTAVLSALGFSGKLLESGLFAMGCDEVTI